MGVRFIKVSVVYFVAGVFMGMFMSITHQFQFTPSHAHINLLGWTSLALAGAIYCLFPQAGQSPLGKWHFWLHNLGLPIMSSGLIILEAGNRAVEPVIGIGASMMTVGIILFFINVFRNVKAAGSIQAKKQSEHYTA